VRSGDLQTTPITSLSDPRVCDYAGLRDAQLRQLAAAPGEAPGIFIAEGELVVRQLIASLLRIRSIFLTPPRLETMRDALERLAPDVPIFLADQPLMNGIVGFNIHRGILAAGQRPAAPSLDGLLAASAALVILEDLANHDNVGGIFRAAAGLAGIPSLHTDGPPGGASVLLSPRTCDPLYRKAIRVSMGTALHIPFARLSPWPEALASVKGRFTLVALTPDSGATPIDRIPDRIHRPALLLGAEGPGLTPQALAAADLRVRIPIDPRVDSLNVVVAAAIALHHLCRQAGT
jgi:tRNA G18 (ribose-2'-O)-methylase SpoU